MHFAVSRLGAGAVKVAFAALSAVKATFTAGWRCPVGSLEQPLLFGLAAARYGLAEAFAVFGAHVGEEG
ncbi:hypothetical protein GCM10010174_01770 [Kutzneria viridogrisea]